MGTLDDLRQRAKKIVQGDMCGATGMALAEAVLALPDSPEVPEGKVLVDEERMRAVQRWINRPRPMTRHWADGDLRCDDVDDEALDALCDLVAALPAPEWEPSDELVERYGGVLDDHWPCEGCHLAITVLRCLRAVGLLNPEVTDGLTDWRRWSTGSARVRSSTASGGATWTLRTPEACLCGEPYYLFCNGPGIESMVVYRSQDDGTIQLTSEVTDG